MENTFKSINFKCRKTDKSLSRDKYMPYVKRSQDASKERMASEHLANVFSISQPIKLRLNTQENQHRLKIHSDHHGSTNGNTNHNIIAYPLLNSKELDSNSKEITHKEIKKSQTQANQIQSSNQFKQIPMGLYNTFLEKIDQQNLIIKQNFERISQKMSHLQIKSVPTTDNNPQIPQFSDEDQSKTIKNGQTLTNTFDNTNLNGANIEFDEVRLQYLKAISLKNNQIEYLSQIVSYQQRQLMNLKSNLTKNNGNIMHYPSVIMGQSYSIQSHTNTISTYQKADDMVLSQKSSSQCIEQTKNKLTCETDKQMREAKVDQQVQVYFQNENALQQEIQKLKQQINQLNACNMSMQSSIAALLNNLTQTQANLYEAQTALSNQLNQYVELQTTYENTLEMVNSLKEKNAELQARTGKSKKTITLVNCHSSQVNGTMKMTSIDDLERKKQEKQSKPKESMRQVKQIRKSHERQHRLSIERDMNRGLILPQSISYSLQKEQNRNENKMQKYHTKKSLQKIRSSILSNKIVYFRRTDSNDNHDSMQMAPNELNQPLKISLHSNYSASQHKITTNNYTINYHSPADKKQNQSQYTVHPELDRLKIAKNYLKIRRRSTLNTQRTETKALTMLQIQKRDQQLTLIRRSIGLKMKAFQQNYQQLQKAWMQRCAHRLSKEDITRLVTEYPFFLTSEQAVVLLEYMFVERDQCCQVIQIDVVLCKLREFIPDYEIPEELLSQQEMLKKSIFLRLPQVLEIMKRNEHQPGLIRESAFVQSLKEGGFGNWEIDILLGQCCIISKDVENLAYEQFLNVFLLQ